MIPIVDVSDTPPASGNTKRISINNILACSPSATLASATITGDLTVATSALKVVSASSRVLINQASAIQGDSLEVSAKSDGGTISLFGRASDNGSTLSFRANGVTTQKASIVGSDSGLSIRTGTVERYQIDTTGVSTWSVAGTTAMTLNSTGLGVGVAPTASKLQIGLSAVAAVPAAGATGHNFAFGSTQYGLAGGALTSGNSYIQATRWDGTATNYDLLIQPNGGNVGIGVTPSYLLHTAVASGANRNIARFQVTGASNGLTITWNHATTKMIVNFSDLPTSSAGLASGDLWIDTSAGNTLKVA
jgi:hypothetical protein